MGNECFSACPNPTNQSSVCWADCFFTTTLGKGASTSTSPTGGMGPDNLVLVALWTAAFDSEDPTKGGCPSVPTADYKWAPLCDSHANPNCRNIDLSV